MSQSVYPPQLCHLSAFITHSYSLSSWQKPKCKHTVDRWCAFSSRSDNKRETSKDKCLHVCRGRRGTVCRDRQTAERLGTKRRFHENVRVASSISSVYTSLVSLVRSDTACSVCGELKKKTLAVTGNVVKTAASFSEAAADEHLSCCLHTSGAACTAGVSPK